MRLFVKSSLAGLLFLLVSCGGSEVDGAVGVSSSTSSSISTTTTAVVTSTTSTTASTTTEPLHDEVEAAVREAHTRFMTEMFTIDERVTDPLDRLPIIEELSTGVQYRRSSEAARRRSETGEAIVAPGYVSNIAEVEIYGTTASVMDCSQGLAELYSPVGELLIPADDFFKFRTTELVLVDGVWKVSDFFAGGDDRCDPEDF